MQPPMKNNSSDDYQTPPSALDPLLPYLDKNKTIWECAAGKGYLVSKLKQEGFKVVDTDILMGFDFITKEPNFDFDTIITNPPYSKKYEFLKRAYELNKPFAFLMPLTILETEKRQTLFKKYGIEILLLKKRINFITPSGKDSGSWFAVAWFCWRLLPKQITFSDI